MNTCEKWAGNNEYIKCKYSASTPEHVKIVPQSTTCCLASPGTWEWVGRRKGYATKQQSISNKLSVMLMITNNLIGLNSVLYLYAILKCFHSFFFFCFFYPFQYLLLLVPCIGQLVDLALYKYFNYLFIYLFIYYYYYCCYYYYYYYYYIF